MQVIAVEPEKMVLGETTPMTFVISNRAEIAPEDCFEYTFKLSKARSAKHLYKSNFPGILD